MKKLLLLAAIFATGFSASAQTTADQAIKVNTEDYNFGKIKQGVPVTTYFVITNTTDKPIAIENATAGCGCTTPEFSKEPLAPGASTKLKVGYNAAAMGPFKKNVNIQITGYQQPKVIYITGEVVGGDSAATPANVNAATPAIPAKKDVANKKAKKKTGTK
jgi:hypothetical protein